MKRENNMTDDQFEFQGLNETEMETGLDLICETEGISRPELEHFFEDLIEKTEQQVQSYQTVSNHLTVRSQQLRTAVAVFLLVASMGLLMSSAKNLQLPSADSTYYGAYNLAAGNKLVP